MLYFDDLGYADIGPFGSKLNVYAEELLCVALARKLGVPVRWNETRSENTVATIQGRGLEEGDFREPDLVELTEAEGKAFWPIYDDFLNRKMKLVEDERNTWTYAQKNADNLSDAEILQTQEKAYNLKEKQLELERDAVGHDDSGGYGRTLSSLRWISRMCSRRR